MRACVCVCRVLAREIVKQGGKAGPPGGVQGHAPPEKFLDFRLAEIDSGAF